MALGLGASKGLSYVNDWDKDIERVYQQAEYAAGVKAKKEQETLFYANLMKKGHGSTPYVEGKLNNFYKEHTKKVADFAINNPNFRTDVSKMQEFLDLNDQFLNNPILQQDQQVKQQFEKLQAAYNSKQISKTHFDREMAKYTAYAYADPNSDADPYMFADPKQVDVNKMIGEAQQITPKVTKVVRNGVKIDTYQGLDATAVMNTANSLLADEDNQIAMQKEYGDAIARDPSIQKTYKTLQEYTAARIEAGDKMQMVKSDYDEAYLRNLSNGGKTEVPGAYFMRNIYPTLSSLKDGERASGDLHGLPLTAFNQLYKPIQSDPSQNIKVKTRDGEFQDIGITINMEATNFTGYVRHGGKLYGEVSVNANSGVLDKEGKSLKKGLTDNRQNISSVMADDYLTALGFTPGSSSGGDPIKAMLGGGGKDYTGKVYIELDTSTSRLVDVDESYGGQTEVPKAQSFYDDPIVALKVNDVQKGLHNSIQMLDPVEPEIQKELGQELVYIKKDGKLTDANGQRFVRNIRTGVVFNLKES